MKFFEIDDSLREFVSSSNYTLDDLCLRFEENIQHHYYLNVSSY